MRILRTKCPRRNASKNVEEQLRPLDSVKAACAHNCCCWAALLLPRPVRRPTNLLPRQLVRLPTIFNPPHYRRHYCGVGWGRVPDLTPRSSTSSVSLTSVHTVCTPYLILTSYHLHPSHNPPPCPCGCVQARLPARCKCESVVGRTTVHTLCDGRCSIYYFSVNCHSTSKAYSCLYSCFQL